METFSRVKSFVHNPAFAQEREAELGRLDFQTIDPPIMDVIKGFAELCYCFTLQSCYGHFVHAAQPQPRNLEPVPAHNVGSLKYRIAYLAFCLENSTKGKRLRTALEHIPAIDPEYVQRLAATGYEDLTPSRMIEFAIHDIEAEYVERMASVGYEDLTPDRLIEFAIHDVDAEYVERMAAIGYEDLTPQRIIEFAIHDVDAEYVEQMAALGYEQMAADRIIEFRLDRRETSTPNT